MAASENWERLVRATLRREELRLTALRTPSEISLSSSFNSSTSSFSNLSPSPSALPSVPGAKFSYREIIRATNGLDNSNIIMRGHLGDIFRGILDDGTPVVIKRIVVHANQERSYVEELESLRYKFCHHRFVPLIGHCLSKESEKFLVYLHFSNRDLSSTLPSLDWKQRLEVAISVAEGLSYLHHECEPPQVHGDIHASTILLDDDFEVRLGIGFTQFPRTELSRADDVYHFGKVLIEMVTGEIGMSSSTDWLQEKLLHIGIYDEDLFVHALDPSIAIDEDRAWPMAIVAKYCLSPEPSKRPPIRNVLKILNKFNSRKLGTTTVMFTCLFYDD